MFSEAFVPKYLYKRDSNTSTCILLLERENLQEERECFN